MRSESLLAQMMELHPSEIDLSLDRAHRLLAAMGNPERLLPPVVHIAGTNGKGSTHAMLRAGIEGAGQKVHAYTSPHLVRFHERIRLSGEHISEAQLCDVLSSTLSANGDQPITFFEASTAAAFLAFSQMPADYLLLEVGLGGRLDVTNVVTAPRLTVITPVDLDHQDFLGETLAEIAAEKAGILKRGVPCVVASQHEDALDVIEEKAARLGAPLLVQGQHWHVWEEHGRLVFQDENGLLDLPLPALAGAHQIENAGTALAALRALGMGETAAQAAMENAEMPARMQRLIAAPVKAMFPKAEVWLDGGHNPAAAKALAATLRALPERPSIAVFAMSRQRDPEPFLAQLSSELHRVVAVPIAGDTPSVPTESLARAAIDAEIPATQATSLRAALQELAQEAPEARIVICGSLYLAGEFLAGIEADDLG